MNIFVLDLEPQKCAEYHCDKHLVKMITEHNQILAAVKWVSMGVEKKSEITQQLKDSFYEFPRTFEDGKPNPYGITHKNHPCTIWARQCWENFDWLIKLNLELCKEYTRRYERVHAGEAITRWYSFNRPALPINDVMTPFAQAMPEDCQGPDAITAYRNYYVKYKKDIARWNYTGEPEWFKQVA